MVWRPIGGVVVANFANIYGNRVETSMTLSLQL
jgi:hypothetical protein